MGLLSRLAKLDRGAAGSALVPVLIASAAVAVASATSNCGGDVVVDDPPSGQGGAGQSSSGPGPGPGPGPSSGPGPTTTGPTTGSVTSTGPGPGPGPQTAVSSSTGPGDCATCAEFISGESQREFCPGSDVLYNQIVGCLCMVCALPCEDVCAGSGEMPTPQCENCLNQAISGPCEDALNACLEDF